MTKRIVIKAFAGAAVLAVSSCVKVEAGQEAVSADDIVFEVIEDHLKPHMSAPQSKATVVYGTGNTFISSAFFLPAGQTWDGLDTDGKPYRNSASAYISYAEISYVEDIGGTGGRWKDKDRIYYWPKEGSLTFFAYSPSSMPKRSTGNGTGVSTGPEAGVEYRGWKAEGDALSCDFMVAEPARDRTGNGYTYYHSGVPMLFRHKLAQIQFVAFVEKDDAGIDDDIYIESLSLTDIYSTGDFSQNNTDEGAWNNRSNPEEYVLYRTDAPEKLSTTELKLMPSGLEAILMIPQNLSALSDDDISIGVARNAPEISITYYRGTTDNADRKTVNVRFEDIHSYIWGMGTKVKYSIIFGDTGIPILFDPSVGSWGNGQDIGLIVGGGLD